MASPPTTAPPSNSTSPSTDGSSPPPKSSPSPPPPDSSPPPPKTSPPPAQSPPPPSPTNASPPPPSSPPPPANSNSPPSPKFSPPPPPRSSQPSPPSDSGSLSPPAPKDGTKSSPSGDKSSHKSSPSSDSGSGSKKSPAKQNDQFNINGPIVIGIIAGVLLFFILLLASALACCCRKKKSKKLVAYYDAGGKKGHYSNPPVWQPQGMDHNIKIPPPPGLIPPPPVGGGWQLHGPPAPLSGEMSSNYSGPHGTALPPPSPTLSLGFNKSTFTYEELAAATSGFSQSNMLGQGGFGYVYKGILPNGKEVAIKQLKAGSGQGEREFHAEVEIISRVHHRHLVSLVGYCIAGAQRLLVYEFVPNKTLEYHLHGNGVQTMDWQTRLKIAIGAAKGLAYLHEDCHPRIIHRDIKTANILLDYKFEAMVADFGLAKLSSDTNTHVSTRIMGTFGYLAPEYASSGKLTDKSDVFSYGVMLLELITGRKPVDHTNRMEDSLVDWARPILGQILAEEKYDELVDPRLEGNYNKIEMHRMITCAAASVRHSGRRRPRMSQVVRALEGDTISFEDISEGAKSSGQSAIFSSSGSEFESGTYSSKMRHFNKIALASGEYTGEYSGITSEYGLNPSESSSSGEMQFGSGQRPRQRL